MSILEEIYYGTYRPCEQVQPDGKESETIHNHIQTIIKALHRRVPDVDYKLVQDMIELYSELISVYAASSYVHGFKAGFSMNDEINCK